MIEGPAQLEPVKERLSITDDQDDTELQVVVDAANELVRDLPISQPAPAEDGEWPSRVVLGATMLAVRWWQRRNTPTGDTVGDFGVAYVRRTDPDIAQLLQMGIYAPPVFG